MSRAPYPYTRYPITTDSPGHVDIACPLYTPVLALRPGTVEWAGYDAGYGWSAVVAEADGRTRYAHMAIVPSVIVGASVTAQSLLGFSGDTGHSSGPHLHLSSVDLSGKPIDPLRDDRYGWQRWVAVGVVAAAFAVWMLV